MLNDLILDVYTNHVYFLDLNWAETFWDKLNVYTILFNRFLPPQLWV
ncbi:hypothetical protein DSUL_50460 [Desulfovibrionales bacterium]